MRSIRQLAPLLLLATANLVIAQDRMTRAQSGLATVEGRVTNIADGRPIGGAEVRLESQTQLTNHPTVITDSTGRYRFANVPPDEYHFRIEVRGYRVYETQRDPTRLPIQARGGAVVQSDHAMSRGAAIVGRVADAAGDPLVGAPVLVERDAYVFGERYRERLNLSIGALEGDRITVPGSTNTDDEGRFRVERLAEGDYYLSVHIPPASPVYYPATSVSEGAVAVRVTKEAEIRGQELGGINIRFSAVPTVSVRGRIEGFPEERAYVALLGPGGRTPSYFGFVILESPGPFEMDAPPHGEYELHAGNSNGAGIASISVGAEGIEDVVIGIRPAVSLTGEFVWESTPSTNVPWERINVALARQFAQLIENFRVRSDGTFSIPNIQPVPARLLIRQLPKGIYVESALHGATDALSGEFNPADNPQATLRIRLGNQPGVVRGTVVEPDGDPVVGAVVILVPDAERRQRMDLFQTVASGEDGRFEFDTAVPGTYFVFAWDSIPPGAIQNEAFRLPYEARASRVHVERLGAVDVEVDIIER